MQQHTQIHQVFNLFIYLFINIRKANTRSHSLDNLKFTIFLTLTIFTSRNKKGAARDRVRCRVVRQTVTRKLTQRHRTHGTCALRWANTNRILSSIPQTHA